MITRRAFLAAMPAAGALTTHNWGVGMTIWAGYGMVWSVRLETGWTTRTPRVCICAGLTFTSSSAEADEMFADAISASANMARGSLRHEQGLRIASARLIGNKPYDPVAPPSRAIVEHE